MTVLQNGADDTMHDHIHAGHDHGAFGELVESLFAKTPLSEQWQEFFTHFFIDIIQIFALLLLVMTVVYFLNSYINMDKLHQKLAHLKSLPGFLLAAAAGVLSPFCSCSIIPVLMGFLSVGVPVSVCLCYLTASSMLNITALLSVYAVTGPAFGTTYLLASLFILAVSSLLFSLLRLDSAAKTLADKHHHHHEEQVCDHCIWHRIRCALLSALTLLQKCWIFILFGVLLSSAIMTFFSMDTITRVVNENEFLSATIVSLIGIPIHSDIFSVSPVLLLLQEISPVVALSFATATMAISVPSIVILTRALKTKTVLIYCGILIGIVLLTSWLCIPLLSH